MTGVGPRLVRVLRCGNTLGEGVVWDDRDGAALWTDIEARVLCRSGFPFEQVERFPAPERIGSFGLLADVSDQVVAAFESGFALYAWRRNECRWLDRPHLPPSARFNDGRVDRRGVFWAGTMIEDPALRERASAALFRLSRHGRAVPVIRGVQIANSLCWSPDGAVMYFADTPRRVIWAFDVDGDGLVDRREFARTPPGAHPDGSTVDAQGYLWNAQWGAGRVVRYAPDGKVDLTVTVPAPQVSCVAFGGPALSHLLVTSARAELTAAELAAAPDSGALFVYESSYRGLPESRCTLPGSEPGPAAERSP